MLRHGLSTALLLGSLVGASACAAGNVELADVSRDVTDATSSMDAGPMDTGQPSDTGVDTTVPRDTGRDVATGTDTSTVRDTGPTYCPDVCRSDAECQTLCPTPAAGYHYCCQLGPGGGTCSQRASACTTPDPVGDLGASCSGDTDCYIGLANCCFMIGSAGTCGCHGVLGCNPPMLCM